MDRGEREAYNPYPEQQQQGGHHHHHPHHPHFGHQEAPQYGSDLQHKQPPPPSRPSYGEEQGPYGQERHPGPYGDQQQQQQQQRYGGGYEERRESTEYYPPGPNPYGSSAAPASGHGYGDESYHTSPYAPAPNRASGGEVAQHRRRQIPGVPVRVHCKADPNFSLGVSPGQGPIMLPTDSRDDYQVWYKDETMGTSVKDETGASAFSLINKATGEALRHAPEDLKQCMLTEYEESGRDESVWWTMSEDMGHGYRCIRLATQITRNLDVLRGDKKSGGVKQGAPVITFPWKKQDNQIWKMTPACMVSMVMKAHWVGVTIFLDTFVAGFVVGEPIMVDFVNWTMIQWISLYFS